MAILDRADAIVQYIGGVQELAGGALREAQYARVKAEEVLEEAKALRAELQDVARVVGVPRAPDAPLAAVYDRPIDPHWGA